MRSAAKYRTVALAMVVMAGGAAGCATTVYHPVNGTRVQGDPRPPATTYGIIGKNGKGELHVFSMGGEKLPVGPSGASLYLHLRLAARNAADDMPWVLDPNDQHLGLEGRMLPAAFSTTSQGRPVLWLSRGASGYLDLYYPLPNAGDPMKVTLAWRLRRGTASAAQVTEFVRVSGRKMDEFASVSRGAGGTLTDMYYYHHYTGAHWGMGWWWPESCLWWHSWDGGGYGLAGRYYDDGQRWQQHPTPRTLARQTWVAEPASRDTQEWARDTSSMGGGRSGGGYGGSSETSHWRNPDTSSSSSHSSSSSSSSAAESGGGSTGGGGSAPTFAPGDAAKSGWRGGGAN